MQVLDSSTLYWPPSLLYSVHREGRVSFNFESPSHPELFYFQMVMGYGFFDMDISQRKKDMVELWDAYSLREVVESFLKASVPSCFLASLEDWLQVSLQIPKPTCSGFYF